MKKIVEKVLTDDLRVRSVVRMVFQNRHHFRTSPVGRRSRQGIWHPDDVERVPGSFGVRTPSRSWPNSYIAHARTRKHVCNLIAAWLTGFRWMENLPPDVSRHASFMPTRFEAFRDVLGVSDDDEETCALLKAAVSAGCHDEADELPWLVLADRLAEIGLSDGETLIRESFSQLKVVQHA